MDCLLFANDLDSTLDTICPYHPENFEETNLVSNNFGNFEAVHRTKFLKVLNELVSVHKHGTMFCLNYNFVKRLRPRPEGYNFESCKYLENVVHDVVAQGSYHYFSGQKTDEDDVYRQFSKYCNWLVPFKYDATREESSEKARLIKRTVSLLFVIIDIARAQSIYEVWYVMMRDFLYNYDFEEMFAIHAYLVKEAELDSVIGQIASGRHPQWRNVKPKPKAQGISAQGILDDVLLHWENLRSSVLLKNGQRVLHVLLTSFAANYLGFKVSEESLNSVFGVVKPKPFNSLEELAFTTVTFVRDFARVGYECFVDGSLQPLLYKDRSIRDWLDSYASIIRVLDSLPVTESYSDSEILANLDSVIARGQMLQGKDPAALTMLLRDLMTRRSSLLKTFNIDSYRSPPFSILLHGPPNIGKSHMVNMLGTCYHAAMHQPLEDYPDGLQPTLTWDPRRNVYTRNAEDEYWSQMKGAQSWYIVLDDLAKERAFVLSHGQTTSISEIITVVNSIGIATNQASLEDKGTIPLLPKLVVGTTNIKHLNASVAVETPSAILRRFPYVVEPRVLPEFWNNERCCIDTGGVARYDIWMFKVELYKLRGIVGEYELVKSPSGNDEFTSVEFTNFIMREMQVFVQKQMALEKTPIKHGLCEHGVLSMLPCEDCDKCTAQGMRDLVYRECGALTPLPYWHSWLEWFLCTRIGMFFVAIYLWFCGYSWYYPRWWHKVILSSIVKNRMTRYSMRIPHKVAMVDRLITNALATGVLVTTIMMSIKMMRNFMHNSSQTAQGDIWAKVDKNSEFKVPETSKKGNQNEVIRSISRSTFKLHVQPKLENAKPNAAYVICLRSGIYLTVKHIFPSADQYQCRAEYSDVEGNANPSNGFILEKHNVIPIDGYDLVVLIHPSFLPRRELWRYLPKSVDEAEFRRGFERVGLRSPNIYDIVSFGLTEMTYPCKQTGISYTSKVYDAQRPGMFSSFGECGSLCLFETCNGYFIAGMHVAGSTSSPNVYYAPLSQDLFRSVRVRGVQIGEGDQEVLAHGSKSSGPLQQPSHKGPHHWIPSGSRCIILGSYPGRISPTSKVRETRISNRVCQHFGIVNDFAAPVMKPLCVDGEWLNPFTIAVGQQSSFPVNMLTSIIDMCKSAYLKDILVVSKDLDFTPVSLEIAINGLAGVDYIDSLPMSTSGGFLFPGPKRSYFGSFEGVYYPSIELQERIDQIKGSYEKGERACVVFQGTLKDEPLKMKKVKQGKTRVFTACDVGFSIVVRQQYIKLCKFFSENNFLTECAVGMNCYADIWQDLYYYLTKFGEDRIVAGDYAAFDKNMPAPFIMAAFEILNTIINQDDDESNVRIRRGIMNDLAYPIVNMNGDVFQFFGGNSSGHPLTVIINSIVNSLYVRYAYYTSGHDLSRFRERVHLMTLGDDNIFGCAESTFNHSVLQRELARIDIPYTMADKEAVSVPFINISEADFLKRKFVFLDGKYRGPLAKSSIFKSLCMYLPKGNISEEEQIAQTVLSALQEITLHGKAEFDDFKSKLLRVISDEDEIKTLLHPRCGFSYDEWIHWFDSAFTTDSFQGELGRSTVPNNLQQISHPVTQTVSEDLTTSNLVGDGDNARTPSAKMNLAEIRNRSDNVSSAMDLTTKNNKNNKNTGEEDHNDVVAQAEQANAVNTFVHPKETMVKSAMLTPYMGEGVEGDASAASIAQFLERSIRIRSDAWAVGAPFSITFNPWDSYLTNTVVANKLQNYNLLKGDLVLTFYVNGTKFHIGMMLASYRYLNQDNALVTIGGDTQHITFSQRPHVLLNTTTNKQGCLCIPFFYPQNFLSLTQATVSAANMGTVNVSSFANLAQLNGGTDSVTLTVFAHMENVTLSGPSASAVAISGVGSLDALFEDVCAQGNDEYEENGVISGPASAISKAAGLLSSTPVIGPYALATQMVASTIGNVARMFGYSRPVNISDVPFMRPTVSASLALSEGSDTAQKLTLTGKQEISIDPGICGVPGRTDEMDLKFFTQKQSYITQFPWTAANTVGSYIFKIDVDPMCERRAQGTNGNAIIPTSLSFVSRMFSHWCGSLKFRFQIVGSMFHSGRFTIIYEPNSIPGGATNQYNTTFNFTGDLDEARDFEVTVNWQNDRIWSDIDTGTSSRNFYTTTSPGTAFPNRQYCNGALYFQVANELVTPDATTGVTVLVWISAGDDFQLQNPSNGIAGLNITDDAEAVSAVGDLDDLFAQGFGDDDEATGKDDNPDDTNVEVELTRDVVVNPARRELVAFGEVPTHLRQLLKRYNYYRTFSGGTFFPATIAVQNTSFYAFPLPKGFFTTGVDTTLLVNQYNYVAMTTMNYLRGAYAGWRGSIRWKFFGDNTDIKMTVHRTPQTAVTLSYAPTVNAITGSSSQRARNLIGFRDQSPTGMALTTNQVIPVIEVEIPYMLNTKFSQCKRECWASSDYTVQNMYPSGNTFALGVTTSTVTTTMLDAFVAAGEDFSFMGFIGAPVTYAYTYPSA